jgi:hypothetical protein
MHSLRLTFLMLLSAPIAAAGLPGAPGSVTPQPYAPTPQVPIRRGAERPPLLPVLPPAQPNQPPSELRPRHEMPRAEPLREPQRDRRPSPAGRGQDH